MRRLVTVGLVDLKILVGMCMDQQVDARAQVMVLNQPGRTDPEAALEFAGLVGKAMPEAKKQVRSHFRGLLEALETGKDVDVSLASFVRGLNPASLARID